MKPRRSPFKGVTVIEDRHGRLRFRLRHTIRGKRLDCYLPGPFGGPAFVQAYEDAMQGVRIATRRAQPGTVGYLIATYLETAAFRNLSATTRRDKARRLDWIREAIGAGRYSALKPRHVEALMAKKGGLVAGNRVKKDLAQLFRFGAKMYGHAGPNPAALADANKVRPKGHHSWSDQEIETFWAKHETGTKARLALELLFGTGAARQDAARLTRRNIRGGRIAFRRGKTGVEADLPLLPALAKEIAYLPPDQMMLLVHGTQGKSYTPESFGNWFKEQCGEAGLPHCAAHGLRKAGARRLAEHGATEFEIMSFLAHASAREASQYVAAANRSKLTDSAMAKLGVEPEQSLSNLSQRLDKRGS